MNGKTNMLIAEEKVWGLHQSQLWGY